MAPPKEKKQKISSEPILFATPEAKADIRMFVFNKVFHVSSGLLKIQCQYFAKFLDPAVGICPRSTMVGFHSDWFTAIESDVDTGQAVWTLTSDHKYKDVDNSIFKGNPITEEKAFENLLCAIFCREYAIADAAELKAMIAQADYLRALPVLSNSISGALLNSPGFISSIRNDPCSILASAHKLRHKHLFRESFVYTLGPWSEPRYQEILDPYSLQLATTKHTEVKLKILQCLELMIEVHGGVHGFRHDFPGRQLFDSAYSCVLPHAKFAYPSFIQKCRNRLEDDAPLTMFPFEQILKSSLMLDKTAKAGQGDFEDFFLCFEIEDEELPWNLIQSSW